jgi:hypothetical protein
MRAFFANGVEKMHIPWAVKGLPTVLHLSLFLFFWRTDYFPVQCRPGSLYLCGLVDRTFLNDVWADHTITINSAG